MEEIYQVFQVCKVDPTIFKGFDACEMSVLLIDK